ncbi:MAG: murein hydrolase activator EnvC family protein [Nocardioides sp.]|uniref:murein hydrolase activator EnvC family protein n=1 Tax=Nocardioides sp. TaxID=35761 RepID=UPI003F012293
MLLTHLCAPTVAAVLCLALAPPGSPVPTDDRLWPLDPRPQVVAGFDPPEATYGSGHRGVDLAGRPGQPVLAAAAGTVSFVGSIGGKPVVVVDHGAERTTYEPVVAEVGRGEPVVAGSVVGRLQTVASHCFPAACLHFGVRQGAGYLDPLAWLGSQRVRLLPLWGGASSELSGLTGSGSSARRQLDGWAATIHSR